MNLSKEVVILGLVLLVSCSDGRSSSNAPRKPRKATEKDKPSIKQPTTSTTPPVAENKGNSQSTADTGAKENGVDSLLLPPAIPNVIPKRYKKFKDLLFKGKPVFEELLSSTQNKIVDVAERVFNLKFNSLPVRKGMDTDGGDSQETLEVQAFELLSSIVGRSVRNTLLCSTARSKIGLKGRRCSRDGMSFVDERTDKDDKDELVDPLCLPGDPETDKDKDCRKGGDNTEGGLSGRQALFAGTPLKSVFIVRSTSNQGSVIRLPLSGALDQALQDKVWQNDAPTKIIFTMLPYEFMKRRNMDRKLNQKIIAALSQKYSSGVNHNIVEIQWPEISLKRLSVIRIANRLTQTARLIFRILLRWHKKNRIQMEKLHFIGVSLGAHLAGIVGNLVQESSIAKSVGRITGLDPLGWGFDELDGVGVDPDLELTKDDASFVDVIHTSAPDSSFPFVHYGSNEKRGTVDFYPNNGRARYCSPTDGLCHHLYSVVLYIASISGNRKFVACKCSSWDDFSIKRKCSPCHESVQMGEHIDKSQARGVYYLSTA